MTSNGPNTDTDPARWRWLMALVFLVGLGLRIFGSWTLQYSHDPDCGIASLMAKHMAEGKHFPVFFYGQSYMGSLEPALSSLFCRLLGPTGFAVSLGTSLLGFFILPLIYLWARAAGGRRAGLLAVLFCWVGSDTTFYYGVAPRGGYMTLMVCGLLTLWMAIRIATRGARGAASPWSAYFILGLAAGLGWWSNQMIVPFFAATALVLLLGRHRHMLTWGGSTALAAFFLGSLPWWLWNLTHHWGTFAFAGTMGQVPLSHGLHYFTAQFLKLVELDPSRQWWDLPRLAFLLALLGGFAVLLVRDQWKSRNPDLFIPRMAAVALALVMILVYSTSKYANVPVSRYLLPLYPALAVMLATSFARLAEWLKTPLVWLAFVAVIPIQIYHLPDWEKSREKDHACWQAAQRLVEDLGPLCGNVCIGGFPFYWINFATQEKIVMSWQPDERYAPYGRRAELADNPAFLDDYLNIRKFLALTGGSAQAVPFRGAQNLYHITAPTQAWRYVEASAVVSAKTAQGQDIRDAIADDSLDTAWTLEEAEEGVVTVAFDKARRLCGVHLLSPSEQYPLRLAMEGRVDGKWRALVESKNPLTYFWSGPRVFFNGVNFYQELRFSAPPEGVDQLRLVLQPGQHTPAHVGALLFLEATNAPAPRLPSVEACASALRQGPARRLLAPRWLAGRLSELLPDESITPLPSALTRTVQEPPRRDSNRPIPIVFSEPIALLIDAHSADRTRRLLQANGLAFHEQTLEDIHQFQVEQPSGNNDAALYPRLCWTELGCFELAAERFSKPAAHTFYEKALKEDPAGQLPLLKEALRLYPKHQPARQQLAEALRAQGAAKEAEAEESELRKQTTPHDPLPVRFANGVELLGASLSATSAAPGDKVEITYYWKCPPSVKTIEYAAFVHFVQGDSMFQDDHVLLKNHWAEHVSNQPFQEIFSELRSLIIPHGTPAGPYQLELGLLRRQPEQRLRAKTPLKTHRRAVQTPVFITVTD